MEVKYLSRKQQRKKARIEKKEKKNTFYRQKYQRRNSFDSNKGMRKNSRDSFHNEFKPMENKHDNDEDNEDNEKNMAYKKRKLEYKNYLKLEKAEIKKQRQEEKEENISDMDDLDKEIMYLEKRLNLKSKEKALQFNKKLSNENHDPDLIDFLTNIDSVVNQDLVSYNNPQMGSVPKTKKKIESNPLIKDIKPQSKPKSNPIFKGLDEEDEVIEQPRSVLRKSSISKSDIDIQRQFQKDLTSLINKIAESNISFLFPDLYTKIKSYRLSKKSLYETITSISLKLLLNQEITNLPITSCICSIISLLHYRLGNNFLLFYMKSLFNEVGNLSNDEIPKHKVKNFIFEIIHFYILGNITSVFIYDLIKYFIENFNENYSEYLLLLLSYTGIEIRKESPENLKEIISEINKKYNTMKIENIPETSKIKFIVDMIDDIKHNKYLKFNLSEKFNFFKTFVANHSNKDIKQGETIEITMKDIGQCNIDKLCTDDDNNNKKSNTNEDDDNKEEENEALPDDLHDEKQSRLIEAKMKKMNISTQLKKMIFTSIINAYDINDAFERLTRLNLNKEQNREIIKMIILLCIEEKSYNPFYKCLLEKLMAVNKDHKYTFHYAIWDYMKIMDNFKANELKKIHNLSKLTAQLMSDEKISLPAFLHYSFEDADENTKIFLVFSFDFYFQQSSVTKTKLLFAKLVKNDEHVEFAQRLFQFLVKDFSSEIDLESKEEVYQENFSAAIKVLKRII